MAWVRHLYSGDVLPLGTFCPDMLQIVQEIGHWWLLMRRLSSRGSNGGKCGADMRAVVLTVPWYSLIPATSAGLYVSTEYTVVALVGSAVFENEVAEFGGAYVI